MKKLSNMALILAGIFAVSLSVAAYYHRPFSERMSAFVTDLKARSSASRENILRASALIDGVVLQTGQTFSLNQAAGPYTLERGFQPERTMMGTDIVFTPGGGVCQVASTLYNSAQQAGLEILERVPHTQSVQSVPPGRDATVAYGVADLKFRNPYPYPIKIAARPLRDQLLIEIWGKEKNP